MAGKKGRTDGQSKLQKQRTYKNQAKRYRKLIETYPNSRDKGVWVQRLEFYEKATV